jgi:hypothetical protein
MEHTNALTKKVVGVFEEQIPVKAGFSGFFPEETSPTLEVDVEVQRDSDLIAVDVVRFTEGNKNKFSKVTENKYIPPFFKEDYDFNRDSVYMNTVANGVMNNPQVNRAIANNAVKNVGKNRAKIERAIRKQQADVLMTGVVEMVNGDSIDFRRKAESIVNVSTGSGEYWSDVNGATPLDDIRLGMRFLRNIGNSNGSTINLIMRDSGLAAFLACQQVTSQGQNVVQQIQRINISMPQFDGASGMAFHGQIAAGDFNVNIWTYNEKYTDAAGNTVYYLSENVAIMLPDDFQGKTVFGGLAAFQELNIGGVMTKTPSVVEAKYLIRSYSDEKTLSSTIELTSAPLVIPFTIDKIYTMQILA